MSAARIIREQVTPYLTIERTCKRVVSEYKEIHASEIVEDAGPLGKMLFMDSYIQSAEADSHVYHESLVQPAMCLLGDVPKRVLIGGGGELVTAYEVLKWPTVERVDMVDIDGRVVEMCKKELECMHFNCTNDPRLNLVIGDVYEFIEDKIKQMAAGKEKDQEDPIERSGTPTTDASGESAPAAGSENAVAAPSAAGDATPYDVVIMDICDPTEGYGPARLYTKEFYQMCKQVLRPGGTFATQSTSLQSTQYLTAAKIRKTACEVFGHAYLYKSFVPSFVEQWGFTVASDSGIFADPLAIKSPLVPGPDGKACNIIDELLAGMKLEPKMKYYDGDAHLGMFALGKELNKLVRDEKITAATMADKIAYLDPNQTN